MDHTNGNGIYNTSHPLLDRLVGQLEVEAPCPYNSIPYDYRMSQMWIEGTMGIGKNLNALALICSTGGVFFRILKIERISIAFL